MMSQNDFAKKQIVVFMPAKGDKMSYRNDNLVIVDGDGRVKYQNTCYRIFAILVIGDCSITTGLLRRAKKFGFSICFMTYGFRFYSVISSGLQGNNYLHKKQYEYNDIDLGRTLILNKIINQRAILNRIRRKSDYIKDGIELLDRYIDKLKTEKDISRESLLGIEGNAAKVYFARFFDFVNWNGRKPRTKCDYINSLLDIGYTILFDFIECLLHVYDFDVYQGVLHTNFYMRKSLVCDLVEPFRPIVDWKIRKGINLGQFKKEDFQEYKHQWQLKYKKSSEYAALFMEDILDNKESIFSYIQAYYRTFMKGKPGGLFPMFHIESKDVFFLQDEVTNDNSKL